jgi:hypothetical protein
MSERQKVILSNARPHPDPLPRGEGESFPASLAILRLESRAAITNHRERSLAVPSHGGEGQGEGEHPTIQAEPPYVGCYESK